jgi:ABC-type sugar transport system ATPase subunit
VDSLGNSAGRGGTATGVADVTAVLIASGVHMDFGPIKALDDVSVEVRSGEVHALLGANGAGKSTLVKILAGVMRPDEGQLILDGERVHFTSGHQAVEAGIATVSQELNLFPDLSVLENLFLSREPLHGGAVVDRAAMRALAAPVLADVGLTEAVLNRPLRSLSLGARQLVEIARALLANPRVLILDEPTSALKAAETQRLLDVVRNLRSRDVAVVFVSHFLEDVFKIADVVTILRNGQVIEHAKPCSELAQKSVIAAMLGERGAGPAGAGRSRAGQGIPAAPKAVGPLVLSEAWSRDVLDPVTLTARPGEVVGLAGLEGSGASEVLRLIFGQLTLSGGTVTLPTGQQAARSMLGAVRSGVAYVPADRKGDGLILEFPIFENVTMVTAGPLRRLGLLPRRSVRRAQAKEWQARLGVTAASLDLPVWVLSGGNQQKIVLAKWLETAPSLVLLDDPTRGVDVGAKPELIEIIRDVADSGRVVLYASTDFDEMATLCDRVIVFYRRSVIGELRPPLSEHQLLDAVTGGVIDHAGRGMTRAAVVGVQRTTIEGPR